MVSMAKRTVTDLAQTEEEFIGNQTSGKETVYVGRAGQPGQGPYMALYLACRSGIVERAWFECHGCPSMIRCGDWVTKWAVGREPRSLLVMKPNDLELVVGGLPLGKEFCSRMTVDTLRDAVHQAR